jgi:hypothetical protein
LYRRDAEALRFHKPLLCAEIVNKMCAKSYLSVIICTSILDEPENVNKFKHDVKHIKLDSIMVDGGIKTPSA